MMDSFFKLITFGTQVHFTAIISISFFKVKRYSLIQSGNPFFFCGLCY